MNYTKGEWKATQDATNSILISNENGEEIASIVADEGDVTVRMVANANLMAAAPDMYEALKLTKETVITKAEEGYLITADALRDIIKALAKAEGK